MTGSLRTIAHLDHLNTLAKKRYGVGVIVIQPPFNSSVAASAGTHDYDACLDVYIPGVGWDEQQRFFRANGAGAYARKPPAFGYHIHYFTLPPRESISISDDFAVAGFKVGKYVDGGYSLYGRQIASSQLSDYYQHRTALAGHAHDPSWFPANIGATIFNLNTYISRQRKAAALTEKGDDVLVNLNSHAPLARLGGEAGQALWNQWEAGVRKKANLTIRAGNTVTLTADTNKRNGLPNFGRLLNLGAAFRRLGGKGIDVIGLRQAKNGATIKVRKRKTVNLSIDGHNGHGVKIRVTFPSGKKVTYWLVTANLGRGVSDEVFRTQCKRLLRAFGKRAVYNFQEIDEADKAKEHPILREVFPSEDFRSVGWGTKCPTLVGRKRLNVLRTGVTTVSPGLAKVSPARVLVETMIGPK